MPALPESSRGHAQTLDADPLRYLRGVLAFFLGGGAIVALALALTGVAPRALLLAGLLWTLLGMLVGMVDVVLEPLAEFVGALGARAGLSSAGGSPALGDLLRRAERPSGLPERPQDAVAELEALQREATRLSAADDIRLGLLLANLYQHQLRDPGRALGELRRLIDRYPGRRQTVELRGRLAALRARHFAGSAP